MIEDRILAPKMTFLVPPPVPPTMAPTLPEMTHKGRFWAQNSIAVQNSKELFELLEYFCNRPLGPLKSV